MSSDNRSKKLFENLNTLLAKQDLLIERKVELIEEIKDHEGFLETRDEVRDFLAELYNRSQSSSKEVYEGLLTNLVNEIMPENEEVKEIRFNSFIKSNKTALNIECVTQGGHVRDIYKDKGGTVESIVALGLRFIALSKTQNRRIILLDEPDAWIKSGPKYIPKLAALLPQLARELGMQVIYISHHDPKYFESHARVIELTKQDTVLSDVLYDDLTEEDKDRADGIGWRFIRLTNVKQHENTLLELSPFVNMLIGDGDLGKTAVIDAVESLITNSGRDSLIRDEMPYCRVEIGIEDGMVIEWTYSRKDKRKTLYRLYDSQGAEVQRSESGEEVPPWLHEYLAMAPHNGFDLHIGDAHKTSFILDRNISAPKRAEILSWGGETRQIQMMMRAHSEESRIRTTAINSCKAELNKVKSKLEDIRPIGRAWEAFSEYQNLMKIAEISQKESQELGRQTHYLSQLTHKLNCLSVMKEVKQIDVSKRILSTEPKDFMRISDRIKHLELSLEILKNVPDPINTNLTIASNKDQIRNAGEALGDLKRKIDILSSIPPTLNLELSTEPLSLTISEMGAKLSNVMKKITTAQKEVSVAEADLLAIQKDKSQLLEENDGKCIFCNSMITKNEEYMEACNHG